MLTVDEVVSTLPGATDGAPRWAVGLAAGVQAAVLSLAVIIAPTLAAYVATSADPSIAQVGWIQSVALGSAIWLLGHGAPLQAGKVAVTLMPLGVTTLAVFACYASARRSGHASWGGLTASLGGYLAVVLAVALAVSAGPVGMVRAVAGGACIGALGLGAGLLAQPGAPTLRDVTRPAWTRVPGVVRVGAAAGALAVALLVVIAAAVAVGWIVAGHQTITQVGTSLRLDAIGGTVLAVAQLALVPNLVLWALAYVAGPGFVVGAGSLYSAGGVLAGPLPALPLMGALPSSGGTSSLDFCWPVALVLVGALAGWWLHTRLRDGAWWHPLLACGAAALAAGVGSGFLVAFASGSAGPGRMAEVGASGASVGLAVALGAAIGLVLVVLPSSADLRDAVNAAWSRFRHA